MFVQNDYTNRHENKRGEQRKAPLKEPITALQWEPKDAVTEAEMDVLLADLTISMSDFKKNPAKAIRDAGAQPVAVLNRNKAAFYMVNPDVFEAMMDQIDEARLAPLVKARMARASFVVVDPEDL